MSSGSSNIIRSVKTKGVWSETKIENSILGASNTDSTPEVQAFLEEVLSSLSQVNITIPSSSEAQKNTKSEKSSNSSESAISSLQEEGYTEECKEGADKVREQSRQAGGFDQGMSEPYSRETVDAKLEASDARTDTKFERLLRGIEKSNAEARQANSEALLAIQKEIAQVRSENVNFRSEIQQSIQTLSGKLESHEKVLSTHMSWVIYVVAGLAVTIIGGMAANYFQGLNQKPQSQIIVVPTSQSSLPAPPASAPLKPPRKPPTPPQPH